MGPTDPTGTYRREPEVSPASGGHLAPETVPTPAVDPSDTGSMAARALAPDETRRAVPPQQRARRRRTIRRVRRTLRHVDPVSVFKLSLVFYGFFLIVWLLFVALLYAITSALGVFEMIEEAASLFVVRWEASLFTVEKWALGIGLLFWVFASVLNLVIAFLYNVVADLVGGVEMTFVERDG